MKRKSSYKESAKHEKKEHAFEKSAMKELKKKHKCPHCGKAM
jgi:hypothetical protein